MPLSRFMELLLRQILLDNLCGSFPISFTRLTSLVSACTINALLTLGHMGIATPSLGSLLSTEVLCFLVTHLALLHAYRAKYNGTFTLEGYPSISLHECQRLRLRNLHSLDLIAFHNLCYSYKREFLKVQRSVGKQDKEQRSLQEIIRDLQQAEERPKWGDKATSSGPSSLQHSSAHWHLELL